MATPANISVRTTNGHPGVDHSIIIAEYNKLVTKLRQLTAKLDLDAGVTDANWDTLITAADAASPALLII
jgi:hypothetical protein